MNDLNDQHPPTEDNVYELARASLLKRMVDKNYQSEKAQKAILTALRYNIKNKAHIGIPTTGFTFNKDGRGYCASFHVDNYKSDISENVYWTITPEQLKHRQEWDDYCASIDTEEEEER